MIGSVGRPGKVIYTNLESLKLRRRENKGK
jgi:hypothetical protein